MFSRVIRHTTRGRFGLVGRTFGSTNSTSSGSHTTPKTPAAFGEPAEPHTYSSIYGEDEKEFITLTFVDTFNNTLTIDKARVGDSLLETARRFDIPIPGLCNGGGMPADTIFFGEGPQCRSCHCQVPTGYLDKIDPECTHETKLKYYIDGSSKNTRFACKIMLTPDLDGMTIGLPIYHEEG